MQETQRTKLDEFNKKVSPASALMSSAILYDAVTTDRPNPWIIGGSLALLAIVGLYDRAIEFRTKRQENVIFDTPP